MSSSHAGYNKSPKAKDCGGAGKTGTKGKKSRAKSSTSAKTDETLKVTPWVTGVKLKDHDVDNNNAGRHMTSFNVTTASMIARKPQNWECPCSPSLLRTDSTPLVRQTSKDAPRTVIPPNM